MFAEDGFVSTAMIVMTVRTPIRVSGQCDEVDNDCDGVVDEDLQTDWWLDEDGDGFGDQSSRRGLSPPMKVCSQL